MSGEKVSYVRIQQNEERRLREMETHFRAVQRDLPERLQSLRQDVESQVNQQNERMRERFQQLQKTTESLRSDLAQAEHRHQERLQKTFEKAQREYTGLLSQERSERIKQAKSMQQEYQSLFESERSERQKQIGDLQNRLGQIENREESLRQMAADNLSDLHLIENEIAGLPHERFAPGKLSRIKAGITQGENNLRVGASEAALVNAQNCYLDLIELRMEVLQQEQLFEQAYRLAWEAIKSLIEEVNAHRQGTIYQGEENEFEFEVDFWSQGRLSEITASLEALEKHLEIEKETLTISQIEGFERQATELRSEMILAIETAKMAIINSQASYNVSQIVEDVLKEQGFAVTDGVYEGEDQRGAYALKMRNLGGDEVVTIITPSIERELEYKMQMNFFDRNEDEAVRQNFARAVNEGLNQAGLQTSMPEKIRNVAEPNQEVQDFNLFRQRKPARLKTSKPKPGTNKTSG